MVLFGRYPIIRRKGTSQLYISIITSLTTGRRLFDVLANCYRVIRSRHRILEKDIERFGTKANMRLFINGPQAVEKENTARAREETREKKLVKVKNSLDTFESRLNDDMRIRKNHYTDIKSGLPSSFY
ncbi:hypothetical protein BGX30_004681 [Mortierella sp. GBA39]|nr:hypothetical protein BGX30_004681 [Mortierella sp. GBA39]